MTGAALTNGNDDWPDRPSLSPSHGKTPCLAPIASPTGGNDGTMWAEPAGPLKPALCAGSGQGGALGSLSMLGGNRKNLILATGLGSVVLRTACRAPNARAPGWRPRPPADPEPSEPGASSLATEGAGGGSQK